MSLVKRFGAAVAVLAVLATAAGCNDKPEISGDDPNRESEGNTYVTGFPIVKTKEKLRVLTTKQPSQMDFNEMPFTDYYEEKSNIEIEWVLTGWGSDATQKIQLDFMSGNMPDIVSVTNKFFSDSMIDQYAAEGKIAEVGPLLEKWGPNVKKLMDREQDAYKLSTSSDGKIYSIPRLDYQDNHMQYGNKMYIRKTWLDALGLEIPKTTEEFYNVLNEFKSGDPNGNGEQDEIPFVFRLLEPEVFASWGLNYNSMSYNMAIDQETGKVMYAPASENMRAAIQFYARLYKEDLLNQKVIGEPGRYESTLKSGNVGVFTYLANFTAVDYELADEYVLLPPLDTGSFTPNCYASGYDKIMPNNAVITSSCKNPTAALRWLDYFYTPEGYYLLNNGVPGDIYQANDDGTFTTLRPWQPEDSGKTPGGQLTYGYDESFKDLFTDPEKPDSELTDIERFNKNLNPSCKEAYSEFMPQYPLRIPRMTSELATLLDEKATPMNDYANQMLISFMVGVSNIESEWSSYITELKRLGMDELVAAYQEEYTRTYGE